MAKVMIPKEEYLRRQGMLEENTCCGGGIAKLLWIAVIFATIAAGISLLSKKEA